MKNVIPFTKEIKFDNKISEITTISLEETYDCTSDTIDGEFIISGDYKSHELSVNKEPFEFKLPFSVDLTERIVPESLNFEITDFSYDILNDNILKVNIEFQFDASIEESREEIVNDIEEFLKEDEKAVKDIEEIKEEIQEQLEKEENEFEEIRTVKDEIEEIEPEKVIEEEIQPRITKEDENTIIDSINQTDNEFITYHIHVVKEAETIESICALYNSNTNLLAEYNDLNEFKIGEKLIVIEEDE